MVIIVRHGETYANVTEGAQPLLTEKGIKQSQQLRDKLAKVKIKRIISSDMDRVLATAKIINEKHNLDIEVDPKYREIYRLIVGGPKKLKSKPFRKKEDKKRAESIFKSVLSMPADTAIITHGNLIRYILARYLNIPPNKMWNFYLSPCSIVVLRKENIKLFQLEEDLLDDKEHFMA